MAINGDVFGQGAGESSSTTSIAEIVGVDKPKAAIFDIPQITIKATEYPNHHTDSQGNVSQGFFQHNTASDSAFGAAPSQVAQIDVPNGSSDMWLSSSPAMSLTAQSIQSSTMNINVHKVVNHGANPDSGFYASCDPILSTVDGKYYRCYLLNNQFFKLVQVDAATGSDTVIKTLAVPGITSLSSPTSSGRALSGGRFMFMVTGANRYYYAIQESNGTWNNIVRVDESNTGQGFSRYQPDSSVTTAYFAAGSSQVYPVDDNGNIGTRVALSSISQSEPNYPVYTSATTNFQAGFVKSFEINGGTAIPDVSTSAVGAVINDTEVRVKINLENLTGITMSDCDITYSGSFTLGF